MSSVITWYLLIMIILCKISFVFLQCTLYCSISNDEDENYDDDTEEERQNEAAVDMFFPTGMVEEGQQCDTTVQWTKNIVWTNYKQLLMDKVHFHEQEIGYHRRDLQLTIEELMDVYSLEDV
ncbi:uncharacterized protein [Argopecten irradians]|uniref:uncharacterized protein n=1 Tax=Argopecten irradians TaxID=31199 RepID=UPI00371D92D8